MVSIILVEAAILVPSYRGYERDLLSKLQESGRATVTSGFKKFGNYSQRDLPLIGRLLTSDSYLRGGALYRPDGGLLARFGERPHLTPASVGTNGITSWRRKDGARLDVIWRPEQTGLSFTVVGRLDSSWIGGELVKFVLRISGLVLIISLFVAGATMLVLRKMILVPLLRLRASLIAASEDPDNPERHTLELERDDEFGDVVDGFNNLLQLISHSRRSALAKQSALLEATFETMNQGIIVFDADHRLVAFNQKFVDLFGYPPGFIRTGMSFEEIVRFNAERGEYGPGDVEELVRERVGASDRGKINPRERTRPNGTVIAARRDSMPDGGHVTTYSDITARKRAEEALRASEQRLRDIAESSSDWFWEMDAELRFTYFSERYAEITGFDPKERIGTTRSQFSGKSDSAENSEKWAAHMADMGARRPFRNFEYATTASDDGRVRHVRISGTPIFDANGEFLGYRGTGTDITAQKKAEETLAEQSMMLETTFESISQGIVVYDKDLRVTAFNQKYVDLCGYPSGFVRLGMPIEKIIRFRAERGDYGPVADMEELVRDRARARRQDEIAKRERTGSDGTEVVVSRDPMPDGGYVTTFTDITEIKRAEEALRESEKRLKQHVIELETAKRQYQSQGKELARLVEDLAIARDQAELANRTKSEFLANMSHELRTPLNAILGFSELMGKATLGPLGNPKYEEYARDINDSGRHLLALIQDILDLSKIEAGKLELDEEDIDVARAIRSCMVLVKERARNGGVKLLTDLPDDLPALHADERKLKQILVNLLSNAVKFTPTGGSVTVKAWFRPDSGFVIQVADTGVGIALEDIPKALTPFGQVDSRLDRKYEGTGLGLPLTKSLIEKHSGSLDLQSEVGAGTTVTVRFPPERMVPRPEVAATGYPAA